MGEPSKVQVLKRILDVIKRDNLLDNVQKTGNLLMDGLKDFQVKLPTFQNLTSVKYLSTIIRKILTASKLYFLLHRKSFLIILTRPEERELSVQSIVHPRNYGTRLLMNCGIRVCLYIFVTNL